MRYDIYMTHRNNKSTTQYVYQINNRLLLPLLVYDVIWQLDKTTGKG